MTPVSGQSRTQTLDLWNANLAPLLLSCAATLSVMMNELNYVLHAISTCRFNSAVGIEMIDNISQTEHRFDSTASVGKFGMYSAR